MAVNSVSEKVSKDESVIIVPRALYLTPIKNNFFLILEYFYSC